MVEWFQTGVCIVTGNTLIMNEVWLAIVFKDYMTIFVTIRSK